MQGVVPPYTLIMNKSESILKTDPSLHTGPTLTWPRNWSGLNCLNHHGNYTTRMTTTIAVVAATTAAAATAAAAAVAVAMLNIMITIQTYVVKLANIKYNIDIGLKISTRKCGDQKCPLYGKLKCTNLREDGLANCSTRINAKSVAYNTWAREVSPLDKDLTNTHKIVDMIDRTTQYTTTFVVELTEVQKTLPYKCCSYCRPSEKASSSPMKRKKMRIELLWIDILMNEYPQGLNHSRKDERKISTYYKENN